MKFVVDTRNQKDAFVVSALEARGHQVLRTKLPFGDVALSTDLFRCVDLKSSGGGLLEIAQNRFSKDRDRMKREINKCFEFGGDITFVCFEPGMTCVEDIANWEVPKFNIDWYKTPKGLMTQAQIMKGNYGGSLWYAELYHKKGDPKTKVNPASLMKSIRTMCEQDHYMKGKKVNFQFATAENCGEIIEKILRGEEQ